MKDKSINSIFLLLVLTQAAHSIEEYIGKLWEVFPPARYICSLISNDLETGFLIVNIGLFIIGMIAWFVAKQKGYQSIIGLLWIWVVIEFINGIGHPIWSGIDGGYTPGVLTAPFLFVLAFILQNRLRKRIMI